jgi:hypothetical protein
VRVFSHVMRSCGEAPDVDGPLMYAPKFMCVCSSLFTSKDENSHGSVQRLIAYVLFS